MLKLVADASVSLKWWLDDEEYVDESKSLLEKVVEGEVELVQPELWYYEVSNGIAIAVRRNRITEKQGKLFTEELQTIPVKKYDIVPHLKRVYKDAVKFKYTIYDMVYVSVAELENTQLISGDERLVNTVKASRSFVSYISDLGNILNSTINQRS